MLRHLNTGHKTLPLVIPVLFYNGKRSPYPYSTLWLDGFSNPEQATQLYSHGFPLVDVTVIDDDEIMQHRKIAALTLLMKHIRQRDIMSLLDQLPRMMVGWISPEQVRVLIHYMVNAGEAPAPEFMRALAESLPQLMTIAQQLEQKGDDKGILIGQERGILIGEEKGRAEGKLEGKLNVAHLMLQKRIERNTVKKLTGLTEEELQHLTH